MSATHVDRHACTSGAATRADMHAVLDAAALCHVGYVINGAPFVTPTLHWRECTGAKGTAPELPPGIHLPEPLADLIASGRLR